MFRIGGSAFYDWKNKIPRKILEFKRSGIGLIVEFCGILNGFPNQGVHKVLEAAWHLALGGLAKVDGYVHQEET